MSDRKSVRPTVLAMSVFLQSDNFLDAPYIKFSSPWVLIFYFHWCIYMF